MSQHTDNTTSSPAFFEAKYRNSPDPWNFSKNAYELLRYEAIISAIGPRRYRRAFEPGCSIGILTQRLAQHCDEVYAIDFSPTAAGSASARCAHLPHVEVRCASITDPVARGDFDLIVLSEIGYYFWPSEWRQISTALVEAMPTDGVVLAAHWLGHSEDHCINGDQVHEVLLSNPLLCLDHQERNQSFRLDRLVRV